jgi:hypothetical protein
MTLPPPPSRVETKAAGTETVAATGVARRLAQPTPCGRSFLRWQSKARTETSAYSLQRRSPRQKVLPSINWT